MANQQNAESSYLELHSQALAKLQQLENLLFDLPAPEGEVVIHWGHVGTVGEVNRLLDQATEFLASAAGREN